MAMKISKAGTTATSLDVRLSFNSDGNFARPPLDYGEHDETVLALCEDDTAVKKWRNLEATAQEAKADLDRLIDENNQLQAGLKADDGTNAADFASQLAVDKRYIADATETYNELRDLAAYARVAAEQAVRRYESDEHAKLLRSEIERYQSEWDRVIAKLEPLATQLSQISIIRSSAVGHRLDVVKLVLDAPAAEPVTA